MTAQIKIENIEKAFGDNKVLKGINLDVESGQLVSILGSSGCGKTTLLRIVAGLEWRDSRFHNRGETFNCNGVSKSPSFSEYDHRGKCCIFVARC